MLFNNVNLCHRIINCVILCPRAILIVSSNHWILSLFCFSAIYRYFTIYRYSLKIQLLVWCMYVYVSMPFVFSWTTRTTQNICFSALFWYVWVNLNLTHWHTYIHHYINITCTSTKIWCKQPSRFTKKQHFFSRRSILGPTNKLKLALEELTMNVYTR